MAVTKGICKKCGNPISIGANGVIHSHNNKSGARCSKSGKTVNK